MSTPDPLDQIEYHLSQAMHLLHQYRNTSGSPLPAELAGSLSRKSRGTNNKSLREWVAWLKRNEPAYRQTIWDATGMNLTAPKSSVLDWTSDMAYWDDDQMPSDSLCRLRGPANGPGAPPSIYFLWSQRFDVYGLHGVGPDGRPDPLPESETLLGVIHPPAPSAFPLSAETHGVHPEPLESYPRRVTFDPEPTEESEETATRFATMDEWNKRWVPLFDALAPYGEIPTDAEKAAMIATLPEDTGGEPWSTILARTAQEATVRSRS